MSSTTTKLVPINEDERLAALDSYAVLDTSRERDFDDIVRMAKHIFSVPIALVSFVASDRQFFKARLGMDVCQTDREGSFCTHVVLGDEVVVVPDATRDDRFSASPLVAGETRVRFYAGAPLITPDGFVLGSLCVKDRVARSDFTDAKREILSDLAGMVMERLADRKRALSGLANRKQFEAIAAVSPDAIICADGRNFIQFWSAAAETILGYTAAEAIGMPISIIMPPASRPMHEAGLARAVAGQPSKLIGASSRFRPAVATEPNSRSNCPYLTGPMRESTGSGPSSATSPNVVRRRSFSSVSRSLII